MKRVDKAICVSSCRKTKAPLCVPLIYRMARIQYPQMGQSYDSLVPIDFL